MREGAVRTGQRIGNLLQHRDPFLDFAASLRPNRTSKQVSLFFAKGLKHLPSPLGQFEYHLSAIVRCAAARHQVGLHEGVDDLRD